MTDGQTKRFRVSLDDGSAEQVSAAKWQHQSEDWFTFHDSDGAEIARFSASRVVSLRTVPDPQP